MKKTQALIVGILVQMTSLSSFACDIFQVTSQDPITKQMKFGNGFAYGSQYIIVNDHSLAPDATHVSLSQGMRKVVGQVVSRDFHTDLALIHVPSENLMACKMTSEVADEMIVFGFDQQDQKPSRMPVTLKTEASTKLMVPGVRKSLEVMGQAQMRHSQSGSVLLKGGAVVGLITQKTQEGTALAIPASDITPIAESMISGKALKRGYTINRREGRIQFDGLVIPQNQEGKRGKSTGGIDPHGKRNSNPYTRDQRAPQPIALEDYEVGAVLAQVEDFSFLSKRQPELAQALREARLTRFFISSIDGVQVRNSFELLRVLGECGSCRVDSFWIEVEDPQSVQNSTLKLMGWFSALIVELENGNKPERVKEIVQGIHQMNPLLARLINEGLHGKMDLRSRQILKVQWMEVEKKLDLLWHSERTLDILTEIRSEILE